MNKRICISSGDYNGIGPEVILKTLEDHPLSDVTPIILSNFEVFDYYNGRLSNKVDYHLASSIDGVINGKINLLESYGDIRPSVEPGAFTEQSGRCSMLAVEKGLQLCLDEHADALVTAPISKEAVNRAGYHIPGHTEFLAEHTGAENFMMMLVHDKLRVGLATIHIPVAEIPQQLSKDSVLKYVRIMNQTLQQDFDITTPEIAVLGLNPHAGDGGIIGTEELDFILPALKKARTENIAVTGPHPADGFFGNQKYKNYDAVLAMYHDQGLIPFKTLSFGAGVNFTAGLPIIRTSPDHGTAFDIAGKNKANPSSFKEAFSLALQLAANRKAKAAN
jgi:4-hydroxythreonine-4-phosphate dehydrogenase